jgi:hypothetical protein
VGSELTLARLCSWASRGACATEGEEAAPIQARHGRAAGDQEVPEVHRAAHPLRALRPSGGCLPLPTPTPLPACQRFGLQSVMEAFSCLQVRELTQDASLEVNRWTPQALLALQEVSAETCHVLLYYTSWFACRTIMLAH